MNASKIIFENSHYIGKDLLYGVYSAVKQNEFDAAENILYSELVMIIDHLDINEKDYIIFFTKQSNKDGNSYRLYKTKNGFRTIRVNKIEDFSKSRKQLAELIPDELYFQYLFISEEHAFFRARLTPKYINLLKDFCFQHYTPEMIEVIVKKLNKPSLFNILDLIKKSKIADQFAVCKFINQTGDEYIHKDIKKMVNFHDEQTKAFSNLKLA